MNRSNILVLMISLIVVAFLAIILIVSKSTQKRGQRQGDTTGVYADTESVSEEDTVEYEEESEETHEFFFKPQKEFYNLNEPVDFIIIPNADGYVYLFSRAPGGRLRLIFPASQEDPNFVQSGIAFHPFQHSKFELIPKTSGIDTVYLLFCEYDLGHRDIKLSQIVSIATQNSYEFPRNLHFKIFMTELKTLPGGA